MSSAQKNYVQNYEALMKLQMDQFCPFCDECAYMGEALLYTQDKLQQVLRDHGVTARYNLYQALMQFMDDGQRDFVGKMLYCDTSQLNEYLLKYPVLLGALVAKPEVEPIGEDKVAAYLLRQLCANVVCRTDYEFATCPGRLLFVTTEPGTYDGDGCIHLPVTRLSNWYIYVQHTHHCVMDDVCITRLEKGGLQVHMTDEYHEHMLARTYERKSTILRTCFGESYEQVVKEKFRKADAVTEMVQRIEVNGLPDTLVSIAGDEDDGYCWLEFFKSSTHAALRQLYPAVMKLDDLQTLARFIPLADNTVVLKNATSNKWHLTTVDVDLCHCGCDETMHYEYLCAGGIHNIRSCFEHDDCTTCTCYPTPPPSLCYIFTPSETQSGVLVGMPPQSDRFELRPGVAVHGYGKLFGIDCDAVMVEDLFAVYHANKLHFSDTNFVVRRIHDEVHIVESPAGVSSYVVLASLVAALFDVTIVQQSQIKSAYAIYLRKLDREWRNQRYDVAPVVPHLMYELLVSHQLVHMSIVHPKHVYL